VKLNSIAPLSTDPDWELASEAVSVNIRWFGLVVGVLIVTFGSETEHFLTMYAILALGLVFTAFDAIFARLGRVFLRDQPLVIAILEAIFITLLCAYDRGPDSPFRFYYVLSLICGAIRYSPTITFTTCAVDCLGYVLLSVLETSPKKHLELVVFTIVMLIWVSWAAASLAKLLKRGGEKLRQLNADLEANRGQLETRIAERTRELENTQAQVLHQEKMAGFGLLAAGIAHEVGNPLAAISGVVQVIESKGTDDYTKDKLLLVKGQLARIQGILRELVTFSRPASDQRCRVVIKDVIDEALGIAKYYRGGKSRLIESNTADDLPSIEAIRDQIVQVVFNLVLNAIDATGKGGRISVTATQKQNWIELRIADDGCGIDAMGMRQLFRPYRTTKRHGTGLGLFVTKRIVDAHGGTIECFSELGRGTSFHVSLPLAN
jgi:two-component system NtrC family sensor kinase